MTQQIKTSTADNGAPGDILIESSGSVVVATAGPAVEIDSANTVTNQGTISNIGTTGAIGVQMDANGGGLTDPTATAFDSTGTLDLTGDGTGKTAIFVGIPSSDTTDVTGTFTGGINLEAGSTLKATGDNTIGIAIGNGTTLAGNVDVAGALTLSGGTGMTGVLIGTTAGSDTPANLLGKSHDRCRFSVQRDRRQWRRHSHCDELQPDGQSGYRGIHSRCAHNGNIYDRRANHRHPRRHQHKSNGHQRQFHDRNRWIRERDRTRRTGNRFVGWIGRQLHQ